MTKRKNPEDFLKMGAPSMYTPELAKLICERVATNPVGISTICKMYEDMPVESVIKHWRLKYPDFAAMYLEAKSLQAQILVEECDEMIPSEIKTYFDDKGNERIDAPSASMVIAKINNRKWMAARLAPKIYGERVHTESTVTIKHEDALKDLE